MESHPYETIYLDTLDGFEFEEICAKIIEKLGWGKVNITPKARDGGKDLIVESPNSEIIYVECKHQPHIKIGRPVIQKLHSAIITSKSAQGIIITTGSFSKEAIEYANSLSPQIKLIDIISLTAMAQNVGFRIISEDKVADCFYKLYASDSELEKIQYSLLENVETHPRKIEDLIKFETLEKGFVPIYRIGFSIHETYATSAGKLSSINEDNKSLIINGSTRKVAERSILNFINSNPGKLFPISELQESAFTLKTINDNVDLITLKNLAKQIIIDTYTQEISYRGQNHQNYKKTFYPKQSSILLKNIQIIDLRYRRIRIKQGNYEKEVSSLDSDYEIFLDRAFPFCDYCGGAKKLMICDNCASIVDYGFIKHGKKCSICSRTICVNCLYKYKWPSVLRGFICEECCIKSFGKELSKRRKMNKAFKPNYWDQIKNNSIFKI